MTKEMDEKETIQQVVYNEILYLPLKNMGIKDGARIKRIIKEARDSYNQGNEYNIDINDLILLEACIDKKSGISDVGNAKMYYSSFK